MFGVDKLDHDTRYKRTAEFIEVIRGAWDNEAFDYEGKYYQTDNLRLEPRPVSDLEVFQGGQSDAAIDLAAQHSDWMFLNGGTPERIEEIVRKVQKSCKSTGRTVRFGMYAIPLCRDTDEEAWDVIDSMLGRVDKSLVEKRKERTSGAEGMWDSNDPLSAIDSNEGYAARLIGSPDTILERIKLYKSLGIDMLHLGLGDEKFRTAVFPELANL
jgi:FMNH2-dependent dimethyl sulfone monooxygenase